MTYEEFFDNQFRRFLQDVLLYRHTSRNEKHSYVPFYHSFDAACEVELATKIKEYIYLYSYSKSEVEEANKLGHLDDLMIAAKRAIRERLPNRVGPTSGLWGELLMHLLFELDPSSNERLATRTMYRKRSDNNEIKGFDGMHINFLDDSIELWLCQSKMGGRSYAYTDISKDLNDKTEIIYTSEELYFIADKENRISSRAQDFLKKINAVSWANEGRTIKERAQKLEQFFIDEDVKLIFPCVLVYGLPEVYENEVEIHNKLTEEIEYAVNKFDEDFGELFTDVEYDILIWILPLRNIEALRTELTNGL